MVEFKLVLNTKKGKSFSKQITGKEADFLLGKDIGSKIPGDKVGFTGYEFEITGGSDFAGFPMRKGIKGFGRKRILTAKGVGFSGKTRWKKKKKGLRIKTTVCGEKIYPKITQINLKVLKEGAGALGEEKAKEEAPKAEEKKEAPKKEEKPKEEKAPKEEKKEAPKAEEKPKEEPKKEEKKE
ncbi:MAG: 30S ribosomal protein S6e [Nanoarchaeota archaeon]|nr:30S ribosomal protein S6e [Nanoarchaeota archaeon]